MPTDILLTTSQMAEAERLAVASGISGFTLMQRAGIAVADACVALSQLGPSSAAVLCGPGNNAGDGFIAAQRLQQAGWTVRCYGLGDIAALPADALKAARQWSGQTLSLERFSPGSETLIVDALFGAGLSRDLAGPVADAIDKANASGKPIVAVDMPSGVDGNTGAERGRAVQATVTVTFGRAKPGHYLFPGAARTARLVVADIGIPSDLLERADPLTMLNRPDLWVHHFPWPRVDGHKYSRGHAVVVSGGLSHTGAARLSARAALRIGAGLVTLASPEEALAVNAGQLTAVMVRVSDGPQALGEILADTRKNAVVVGPGLGVGDATRQLVETALSPQAARREGDPARACLLDADALTSFGKDARALRGFVAAAPGSVVVTPHEGEFARLFGAEPSVTGAGSKLDRARAAAGLLGCVVLLKGADTVVAAPDGRATVSEDPVPWLATAGSGDVLSGMIGGLLAQGMPAFEAAAAGSYLHAAAGRRFGPGLIAEDLPDAIPGALRDLRV